MPDKIVNHFVLADGSVARYDYDGLLNTPDIDSIINLESFSIDDWVQGGLNLSTGEFVTSNTRLRTSKFLLTANTHLHFIANGQKYSGCVYNANGTFERQLFGYKTDDSTIAFDTDKLICVTIGKTDDTAITPPEASVSLSCDYPLLDLRESVSDVEEDIYTQFAYKRIQFRNGYVDLSGTTANLSNITWSDSFRVAIVPCEFGDSFTIFGSGGDSTRLYAFVDVNGVILEVTQPRVPALNVGRYVTAPQNSSYLIVHQRISENLPSYYGDVRYISHAINNLISQTTLTTDKWEKGNISTTTGLKSDSDIRLRTKEPFYLGNNQTLTVKPNGQAFNVFVYSEGGDFESAFPEWQTSETVFSYNENKLIALTGKSLTDSHLDVSDLAIDAYVSIPMEDTSHNTMAPIKPFSSKTGNCSIKCAKEQMYADRTPPKIEYYLLEEPVTHDFYISKDLGTKEYAFTFDSNSYKYSFGIMPNGDVIAVQVADTLGSQTKNDNQRTNPFVWLASEKWSVKHTVDFGASLKPCGWLMNCGFRTMPDGTAVFCEYTRMTVATANVWKLSGDLTDPDNWTNTKQFQVTTTDNLNGFKHCHTIQYDFFEDVVYLSTGDSDEGAYMFYSTDRGETWTTLLSNSEKYCRNLNFVFTPDYIYWATDNHNPTTHYVFKAPRNASGILDVNNITDWVNVTTGGSTYGLVYLPEIETLVLMDYTDGEPTMTTMPFHVVDMATGNLVEVTTLYPATDDSPWIGFRVDFMEYYPRDGVIRLGFGFRSTGLGSTVNRNKGFGNTGTSGTGTENINNLSLRVTKNNGVYNLITDTYYI